MKKTLFAAAAIAVLTGFGLSAKSLRPTSIRFMGETKPVELPSQRPSDRQILPGSVCLNMLGAQGEVSNIAMTYVKRTFNLSWAAPTQTPSGAEVTSSTTLTYDVAIYRGDQNGNGYTKIAGATGLTTTSWSYEVGALDNYNAYYATVKAYFNGTAGNELKTAVHWWGAQANTPFNSSLLDKQNSWIAFDTNKDGYTWYYDDETSYVCGMWANYNPNGDMDDWLISPGVKLEKDVIYTISFESAIYSPALAGKISMSAGTLQNVDGMTQEVLQTTSVTTDYLQSPYQLIQTTFSPQTSGTYYFGLHGTSPNGAGYLCARNFRINSGISTAAPMAPVIVADTDPNGIARATINVTAPTQALDGTSLSSLTKLDILRDKAVVKTFDNPTPGETLSFTEWVPEEGYYTYSAIAYNEEGAGAEGSHRRYIGINVPGAPAEVRWTENPDDYREITIAWDAVVKDENGDSIDPKFVSYTVEVTHDGLNYETIIKNTTLLETVYTLPSSDQIMMMARVSASSIKGTSDPTTTAMKPVGPAYDLPFFEDFGFGTSGNESHIWGITVNKPGLMDVSFDLPGEGMAYGISGQPDNSGKVLTVIAWVGTDPELAEQPSIFDLTSGKINIPADAIMPQLSFFTYGHGREEYTGRHDDDNRLEVFINEDPIIDIIGSELGSKNGFYQLTYDLEEYKGKDITIAWRYSFMTAKSYRGTFFDGIRVAELMDNDLEASMIIGPGIVNPDEDFLIQVGVFNNGSQQSTRAEVDLYRNDELIATNTVTGINSSLSKYVPFQESLSILNEEHNEYYAVVRYDKDPDTSNNTTKILNIDLNLATYPRALNLEGTVNEDGNAVLTWSAPDMDAPLETAVNYGFEEAESFATNDLGLGWTTIIGNHGPMAPLVNDGVLIPIGDFVPNETTAGFFIWDWPEMLSRGVAYEAEAYTGSKTASTYIPVKKDDTTQFDICDDYLVSPLLTGDAQTVSFMARSWSAYYPDAISVYYSTTDTELDSWIKTDLSAEVTTEWTYFETPLPEGAKYFAIHSESTHGWLLFIDNVRYRPAENPYKDVLKLDGYRIYRDGVVISGRNPVTELTYTDTRCGKGTHDYSVSVVYSTGESGPSNFVTLTTNSSLETLSGSDAIVKTAGRSIIIGNADGLAVSVFSADGRTVYNGVAGYRTAIEVAHSGVYMVSVGNTVYKVIVG